MRNLEIPEMTQLSTPLLTNGTRQHEALTSVPSSAGLVAAVQAAHDGLVGLSGGVDLDVLASAVRAAVHVHDSLARRIDLRLEAEIASTDDAHDRVMLEQARGQLFPHGLVLIRESDAAKAGEREHRAHRVTAASLALLGTIPERGGGTLADTYAAFQAECVALSAADAEHSQRTAELAGPRVRDARKRWVQAIELVDLSMRTAGLDPTPVLGAIRAAQARSTPSEPPQGEPPVGEPATTPQPA